MLINVYCGVRWNCIQWHFVFVNVIFILLLIHFIVMATVLLRINTSLWIDVSWWIYLSLWINWWWINTSWKFIPRYASFTTMDTNGKTSDLVWSEGVTSKRHDNFLWCNSCIQFSKAIFLADSPLYIAELHFPGWVQGTYKSLTRLQWFCMSTQG